MRTSVGDTKMMTRLVRSVCRTTWSARVRFLRVLLATATGALTLAAATAICQTPEQPRAEGLVGQEPASKSGATKSKQLPTINDMMKFPPKSKGGSNKKKDTQAAQPSSLTSMTLEDMLAAALKDNPDVRLAEAKLRESEADLNRIRLDVANKVMAFRRDWQIQQAKVEEYETRGKVAEDLYEKKAIPEEDWRLALVNVKVNQAQLTKLEEQLPYLLGKAPQGLPMAENQNATTVYRLQHVSAAEMAQTLAQIDPKAIVEPEPQTNTLILSGTPNTHAVAAAIIRTLDQPGRQLGNRSPARNDMTEKIRKALETPIKVEYKDVRLGDVLKDFQNAFGTPFISGTNWENWQNPVTLSLGEVPLGMALEALHDTENIAFDVRDYGILVKGGGGFRGGGGSVLDLWKAGQQGSREDPEQGSKK